MAECAVCVDEWQVNDPAAILASICSHRPRHKLEFDHFTVYPSGETKHMDTIEKIRIPLDVNVLRDFLR